MVYVYIFQRFLTFVLYKTVTFAKSANIWDQKNGTSSG